jgi:prepilin-type N-terminal cleavage/methylation domain-containing protein
MNTKSYRSGFSMMEMIIALAILAIIAVLAMLAMGDQLQKARDARRLAHIDLLQKSLEEFRGHMGAYPVGDYQEMMFELSSFSTRVRGIEDPQSPRVQYAYFAAGTPVGAEYCICADLEKDNGNSDENCANFGSIGASDFFCKRNQQ